jgi:mannose-6-phosphate isomerase
VATRPKTECWYILEAQPGSCVYLGLEPGVDARRLRAQAGSEALVGLLRRHEVRAGDFLFVPGGSVHAIGAGVTLAEVQQTSDTTYRIYDWGRVEKDGAPRPIHLEQALASTRFGVEVPGPTRPAMRTLPDGTRRAELVDCPAFAVELCEIPAQGQFETAGRALVYVVLAGEGRLERAGSSRQHRLAPGDTWLVPASFGEHRIEARAPLRVLQVRTQE